MPKRRRGHHVVSTHVVYNEELGVIRKATTRISTTRQEDEDCRLEQRRKDLKRLRDELKIKMDEADKLIDAPGGLEFDSELEAAEALYDWAEGELGREEMEDIIVVDDDGDNAYEDIHVEEPGTGTEKFTSTSHQEQQTERRRHARRIDRENELWESLYNDLYLAYLEWDAGGPPRDGDTTSSSEESVLNDNGAFPAGSDARGDSLGESVESIPTSEDRHPPITCWHMHERVSISFIRIPTVPLSVTMVRHGFLPTAPHHPGHGISIRVLEVFHAVSSRCPNLGIQPFVRSLCDLHKLAFREEYARSFSRVYDVFSELWHRTSKALDRLLFPSVLDQYNQMCPCCTKRLPNEEQTEFSMLVALDGNESLKRNEMQRRILDSNGNQTGIVNVERPDGRTRESLIFLEASAVDDFKDEVRRSKAQNHTKTDESTMFPIPDSGVMASSLNGSMSKAQHSETPLPTNPNDREQEGYPTDGVLDSTPCTERWSNLSEDSKKKMWGTFDETGVFVAACRHGTVLLMCDMIRSGELAKYPLALSSKLIDLFGERLMIGYDIGCGFSSTARNSKIVGPKVLSKKCQFCVGSFHGHAHERVCQLRWHPLYITGTGLEDFETCERVFSESNRVAGTTRHASKFHRRQAILRHFDRWNSDKYAELSKFLVNNYKQALANISDLSDRVNQKAADLGIDSPAEVFPRWREEELEYLKNCQAKVPKAKERLELEYLDVLKKLETANSFFENNTFQWVLERSEQRKGGYDADARETRRMESANMRGLDSVLTLQTAARRLEAALNVESRWTPESAEWKRVDKCWQEREFDKAVDRLEGLVVARIFELEKMNQVGLCYKLRSHISKALKARSKAISAAVRTYNEAATRVSQQTLLLDEVLNKPWGRKAEREAAIDFFKLERSREELLRLNNEIRRLHVHILESEVNMQLVVDDLEKTEPNLAFQLKKRRNLLRSRNRIHLSRLEDLERWEDFSGDRNPLQGFRMGNNAPVCNNKVTIEQSVDFIRRELQKNVEILERVDKHQSLDRQDDACRKQFTELASVVDTLSASEHIG